MIMNQFKKCKVVMLPTNEKANLVDFTIGLHYCKDTTMKGSFNELPSYIYRKLNNIKSIDEYNIASKLVSILDLKDQEE